MKKLILLLMLVSVVQLASAQDVPFIDFGLKAGANASWARNVPDGSENDGQRFGFVGGAWARIKIPLIGLYVQPEAVISQTGANFLLEPDGEEGELRQTNLDIPILLGQRFGLGPLGLRFNLGPVFTTVLSAKTEDSDGEIDLKDLELVNNFQIGLQAGVGVDISKFNIDLRYQHGFTNVFEGEFTDLAGNPVDNNLKLSALQLTLGYKLF